MFNTHIFSVAGETYFAVTCVAVNPLLVPISKLIDQLTQISNEDAKDINVLIFERCYFGQNIEIDDKYNIPQRFKKLSILEFNDCFSGENNCLSYRYTNNIVTVCVTYTNNNREVDVPQVWRVIDMHNLNNINTLNITGFCAIVHLDIRSAFEEIVFTGQINPSVLKEVCNFQFIRKLTLKDISIDNIEKLSYVLPRMLYNFTYTSTNWSVWRSLDFNQCVALTNVDITFLEPTQPFNQDSKSPPINVPSTVIQLLLKSYSNRSETLEFLNINAARLSNLQTLELDLNFTRGELLLNADFKNIVIPKQLKELYLQRCVGLMSIQPLIDAHLSYPRLTKIRLTDNNRSSIPPKQRYFANMIFNPKRVMMMNTAGRLSLNRVIRTRNLTPQDIMRLVYDMLPTQEETAVAENAVWRKEYLAMIGKDVADIVMRRAQNVNEESVDDEDAWFSALEEGYTTADEYGKDEDEE